MQEGNVKAVRFWLPEWKDGLHLFFWQLLATVAYCSKLQFYSRRLISCYAWYISVENVSKMAAIYDFEKHFRIALNEITHLTSKDFFLLLIFVLVFSLFIA